MAGMIPSSQASIRPRISPPDPYGVRAQGELPVPERSGFVVTDLGLVPGLHPVGIQEFLQAPAQLPELGRVQRRARPAQGTLTFGPFPGL